MIKYTFDEFMRLKKPYKFDIYKKRQTYYCDNIFCFDIEVTSYFVYGGAVFSIRDAFEFCRYDEKKVEQFFLEAKAGALPYIWQFTIDGEVCVIGRELSDFPKLVERLNKIIGARWVCFVHNLHYEHTFIREYLNIDKIFFTEVRKPLYFDVGQCQFRCTYRLTNLSLEKWGEQNGVAKKVGDLDYTVLRTPKTKLTQKEMDYCIFDLLVMVQGLKPYKEQYHHIFDIPYTLTGQVRIKVKELYADDFRFKKFVSEMMPQTYDDYLVQAKTFGGGYVASNVRYTNTLLRGLISKDIASAYPWQVFSKLFPSAPFLKVNAPVNWYDGNAHICLVEFQALESIDDLCVMPSSKRIMAQGIKLDTFKKQEKAILKNNGKVRYADRFAIYCTEQDFALYSQYYKWEKCIIHSHRIAPVDYIDKRFIMLMLELYKNKTELKGVDDEIYHQSKALLNSMSYGMMATAPCRDSYEEIDYVPKVHKCNEATGNAQLQEFKDKPWKNVVPYCWGLYVTSYQRRRVLSIAKKFSDEKGHNRTVYIDTDSNKGFFTESDLKVFDDDNNKVLETIERICKERDINSYLLSPKDKEGNAHTLGVWENDGRYFEFKTMHAKCYAYRELLENGDGGEVKITVAGVPKKCKNVLKNVDDLHDKTKFDIFNSRKNLTTYLDGNNPQVTMPDGYKVTNTCGINLRPTSYTLTLTKQYKELLTMYGNKRNFGAV